MHSKGHVRTEGEGSHLQTKVRGLRRNQPCKYPNSRLPASRTVRKCLLLSLPVCSAPLRQPEQTDTNPWKTLTLSLPSHPQHRPDSYTMDAFGVSS